jgi:hypothetical protein
MGVGELDVPGALQAAERLRSPAAVDPVRAESWLAMGTDTYLADGTTPLQAILELRAPAGVSGAPDLPADGFGDGRLVAYALVDGHAFGQWACVQENTSVTGPGCQRRGPGVWVISVQPPAGLGGSGLTLGATFDGVDIVDRRSVPIATDAWMGNYTPAVAGGCSVTRPTREAPGWAAWWLFGGVMLRRARRSRTRRAGELALTTGGARSR